MGEGDDTLPPSVAAHARSTFLKDGDVARLYVSLIVPNFVSSLYRVAGFDLCLRVRELICATKLYFLVAKVSVHTFFWARLGGGELFFRRSVLHPCSPRGLVIGFWVVVKSTENTWALCSGKGDDTFTYFCRGKAKTFSITTPDLTFGSF